MGQIVRRKKKGRPSKADLARRSGQSPAKKEADIRRSLRRRNVRYNIDYDDYLDEDDEDDEDERRKEKKLKLVVKLNQGEGAEPATSQGRSGGRGEHAPGKASEDEEEEEEDESERKPLKKRRINGGDDDDEDDRHGGAGDDDDDEEDGRKLDAKRLDSVAGTPDPHSAIPLPDKKTLELILDKLQKKDTYGVYAEPVDPEELPDYHDVIEHPMDFATVRKKLANGSYSTMQQFESDVFLICSNAMQYNAPETVYHKQARAIQELGRKKFERLRIELECSEKEQKLVQKIKTNSLVKKPTKKPMGRTLQETVGSDFSSGATLATAADVHNTSNPTQAGGCDRPGNTDGPVDGNLSLNDANVEKAEEMSSGKGFLSKLGRKSFVLDENRRATYNISNEPVIRSESVLTTFECETKQLVAVGLQTEYSYARSLARFSATLGHVAWNVASQRIQQALPDGYKFGRGWVGEYEPLPTPVLMLENHTQKHSGLVMQFHSNGELRMDDRPFKTPVPVKEPVFSGPTLEGRKSLFSPSRGPQSEVNPSLFGSAGIKSNTAVSAIHQQQNLQSRNFAETENKVPKQVELNSLPSVKQKSAELVSEKKFSRNSEAAASKSRDTISRRSNLPQSVPYKSPDANGGVTGGLPNGKGMKNCPDNRRSSPSDSSPNQMAKAEAYLLHGPDRGVNDPVQLMRMLAEKTQKQQKSSDQSSVHTDTQQIMPSVPSVRRDDTNNAAAAAARAWMSIGAGAFKQHATENSNPTTTKSQISADSLYNPTREVRPQVSQVRGEFPVSGAMQFQSEKNRFPVPAFLPQPVRLNEAQFHNRPIIFPQLAAADLSRIQMLPPWRGLSPHTQARQKQEMLPPDLNIGFQSPGSPVKQSGVLVDSQQPDLALQL
ncbi:hypothetical protein FNV43_RR03889 [Rhamnella rubrinervis]|uniref:Bromo domain-containing protein n=1 Tax=Rhamnella rubrinervis TaxID=2594499 RepID=A0A8K0HKR5_9ROSA|nr:hypothetical protein FNV43_RR03889 [Rhamnella rubrinervis]